MTAPNTRAAKRAIQLLEEHSVSKYPVPIREIAKSHAFLMREPLPASVSGMLVPTDPGSKKRWIIAVNKTHSEARQRFTIAHELGHIMLHGFTKPHADGAHRIRFRDAQSALGTDREEVEANQFAAEILLPAALLIPRLRELELDTWTGDTLSDDALARIATLVDEFKVSQQAMLLRIANLLQG